jgi:hypothetical protein
MAPPYMVTVSLSLSAMALAMLCMPLSMSAPPGDPMVSENMSGSSLVKIRVCTALLLPRFAMCVFTMAVVSVSSTFPS